MSSQLDSQCSNINYLANWTANMPTPTINQLSSKYSIVYYSANWSANFRMSNIQSTEQPIF